MQTKSTKGVQLEEVCGAADALIAEGLRPTIERVRIKIGRGSPNTVAPMLETWFASLAPRLGIASSGDEGQGPPLEVRHAMTHVWTTALSAATAQAEDALAQDHATLAGERQELAQARESLRTQQAAIAEREMLLQQSLVLTRSQLDDASRRAATLQSQLEGALADLSASRHALADLVQQHAGERRAHADQLRAQASDLQVTQERAASTEHRLLKEVDRARQDAKQAKGGLAEAQRIHEKEIKELGRANEALGGRFQQAQIEMTSLRERLVGAEVRVIDLQGMVNAQRATVIVSRPTQRRAVSKTRAAPQR